MSGHIDKFAYNTNSYLSPVILNRIKDDVVVMSRHIFGDITREEVYGQRKKG